MKLKNKSFYLIVLLVVVIIGIVGIGNALFDSDEAEGDSDSVVQPPFNPDDFLGEYMLDIHCSTRADCSAGYVCCMDVSLAGDGICLPYDTCTGAGGFPENNQTPPGYT